MTRALRLLSALLCAAAVLPLAACDNGPSSFEDPTTPILPSTPVTETFTSQVIAGNSVFRTFIAQLPGTATLTLSAVGGAPGQTLGFGVGVLSSDSTVCVLSRSTVGGNGTVFSLPVDQDTYCLKVFDAGTVTGPTPFTVTIVRP